MRSTCNTAERLVRCSSSSSQCPGQAEGWYRTHATHQHTTHAAKARPDRVPPCRRELDNPSWRALPPGLSRSAPSGPTPAPDSNANLFSALRSCVTDCSRVSKSHGRSASSSCRHRPTERPTDQGADWPTKQGPSDQEGADRPRRERPTKQTRSKEREDDYI